MTTNANKTAVAPAPAALLDVRAVAAMLNCSAAHIRRLHDAGRLPRCLRIGALLRWRREDIDRWLAAGCPTHRERGGA